VKRQGIIRGDIEADESQERGNQAGNAAVQAIMASPPAKPEAPLPTVGTALEALLCRGRSVCLGCDRVLRLRPQEMART
jgi:hypothetical protein